MSFSGMTALAKYWQCIQMYMIYNYNFRIFFRPIINGRQAALGPWAIDWKPLIKSKTNLIESYIQIH